VEVGIADVHFLDEEPLEVRGVSIEAIPDSLSGGDDLDATAFVLEDGDRTLVVASDDARHLAESALPEAIDLAVFECGRMEHDPSVGNGLTGHSRRWECPRTSATSSTTISARNASVSVPFESPRARSATSRNGNATATQKATRLAGRKETSTPPDSPGSHSPSVVTACRVLVMAAASVLPEEWPDMGSSLY